ncbi:hypothetical protein CLU79DRAFT_869748 [Phycomyces nitens]|nr:hypothetical protein CLU79DRAFT_869748 [Phycomyces nitens]
MSAHKLLFLGVFVLILLPECYAPPIGDQSSVESQQGSQINMSKSYKILKTIILGYVTHIMTIRPSPDTDQANTLFWRLAYFVYPTMGICTAAEVILSACEGEKILGVDRYSKYFEERRKYRLIDEGKDEWTDMRIQYNSLFKESCSELKHTVKRFFKPENVIGQENHVKTNNPQASALESNLIFYDKWRPDDEKYKAPQTNDNIAYLAAILNTLEPRQARRVRNFILNGSLYIGFDLHPTESYTLRERVLYTKDMTVTGSGAEGKYQTAIKPYAVRYLTAEMLNQLHSIQYLDTTSYTAICVTAGQLVYTIINCIDSEGDRWAKVIMLIYMIMSVLQTTSLIVLHKQPVAYSIYLKGSIDIKEVSKDHIKGSDSESNSEKSQNTTFDFDGESKKNTEDSIIDILPEHRATYTKEMEDNGNIYYTSDFLMKLIKKQGFLQNPGYNAFTKHRRWAHILSGFGGLALSLLAGIWANYQAHTTTQWIVLAWIINQLLFVPFVYIYNVVKFDRHWTTYFFLFLIYLIGTGGAGCVIAATVKGYTVKN